MYTLLSLEKKCDKNNNILEKNVHTRILIAQYLLCYNLVSVI